MPKWFHIAMRLTVLGQYAKGAAQLERAAGDRLLADIERIKRLLWHGSIHRAVPAVDNLQEDVEGLEVDYPLRGKFARAVREFVAGVTHEIAAVFDGIESHVIGGVFLRSGGPHVGEAFGGRIPGLGRSSPQRQGRAPAD